MNKTVLVDMDGVVADFVGAVLVGLVERGVHINREEIDEFTYLDWASKHIDWAHEIAAAPGFFYNLEVLGGAIDGVRKLEKAGYQVRFCSSPLHVNKTCEEDKRRWLTKHFGAELAETAFIGDDKTLCEGDILIDDKPEIEGVKDPSWRHLVFDQTWNKKSTSPRMIGWSDMEAVESLLATMVT